MSPYYFVEVSPNKYEVYRKDTEEKVNISEIITRRFAEGAFRDKK